MCQVKRSKDLMIRQNDSQSDKREGLPTSDVQSALMFEHRQGTAEIEVGCEMPRTSVALTATSW